MYIRSSQHSTRYNYNSMSPPTSNPTSKPPSFHPVFTPIILKHRKAIDLLESSRQSLKRRNQLLSQQSVPQLLSEIQELKTQLLQERKNNLLLTKRNIILRRFHQSCSKQPSKHPQVFSQTALDDWIDAGMPRQHPLFFDVCNLSSYQVAEKMIELQKEYDEIDRKRAVVIKHCLSEQKRNEIREILDDLDVHVHRSKMYVNH
ncbi:hypothetical protein RCL1_008755 [Eukaryota sp. TZLM3-RCL]